MKQFITYIPTFGIGQATGRDYASVLAELQAEFPQFAEEIQVREAQDKPVVADVAEEELV